MDQQKWGPATNNFTTKFFVYNIIIENIITRKGGGSMHLKDDYTVEKIKTDEKATYEPLLINIASNKQSVAVIHRIPHSQKSSICNQFLYWKVPGSHSSSMEWQKIILGHSTYPGIKKTIWTPNWCKIHSIYLTYAKM